MANATFVSVGRQNLNRIWQLHRAENHLFSWKELAFVLSLILLVGTSADLLIINEEWERIKARLFNKSQKIKNSSTNDLTFIVAKKIFEVLKGTGTVNFSYSNKKYSNAKNTLIWIGVLLLGVFFYYAILFDLSYFASMVLVVPLLTISLVWFLLIFSYEAALGKWSNRIDNIWRVFLKTSLISACITYIAILIGSMLYSNFGVSEFWFQSSEKFNSGVIKHSEIIGLINYPFDLLSLLFTYLCLKKIIERKVYYPLLPLFDMTFSLILSCVLYVILLSLSEGKLSVSLLTKDIIDVIINGPDNTQFDLIYLLPIILSTFLPITLLSLTILGLIFYKFVSLLFARVLHVLSEKPGSIFKDIALTISAFLTLANAIIALGIST